MRIPTDASAAIEVIGPTEAKEYLDRNMNNRPLKEGVVSKYVEDIQEGRFDFNGESIIFSNTGRLLDGQHRLEAVVRTGVELIFVVARGIPDKAFDTIDLGKNRSVGDIMNILGNKGGAEIGATARIAMAFESGSLNIRGSGRKPVTQKQVVNYIYANPYLSEIVDQVKHARGQLTVSPLAAVLFLGNKNRQFNSKVAAFLEAVNTGENLTRGNPVYTLREWAIAQRGTSKGHVYRDLAFPIIARVWSDYMKGKELSSIKLKQIAASEVEIVGFTSFNDPNSKIRGMTPSKAQQLQASPS